MRVAKATTTRTKLQPVLGSSLCCNRLQGAPGAYHLAQVSTEAAHYVDVHVLSGWTNPGCLDFAARAGWPTWGARAMKLSPASCICKNCSRGLFGMPHCCHYARSRPRRIKPATSVRRLRTSRSLAASSRAPPAGSRPTCDDKLTRHGSVFHNGALPGSKAPVVTAARLRPQRAGAATPTRRPGSTRRAS